MTSSDPGPDLSSNALTPLPRAFYLQPTAEVARQLLGRYIRRDLPDGTQLLARLVETEAYVGPEDLASHSSHGRTQRTAPMFEEAGRAYVYLVYGMYWCLNVVTEAVGHGSAILLRGAEPLLGLTGRLDGPGRLCRALGLDGACNRTDLTEGALTITQGHPAPEAVIATSPRIGVGYAGPWAEAKLRFYDTSSRHVSRPPRRQMGVQTSDARKLPSRP